MEAGVKPGGLWVVDVAAGLQALDGGDGSLVRGIGPVPARQLP